MKKFYITTPIYYVNDRPHIGHAYTTIAADVLARFHRKLGEKVFFLTGTDEHGAKVAESAKKAGQTPKEFVDEMSELFILSWRNCNIKYDDFIRTTEERHVEAVQIFMQKLMDVGALYEGVYEGLYCVACERFYTEKELVNGKCPDHLVKLKLIKEQNYFFKLNKYLPDVRALIERDEILIRPIERKKEVLGLFKQGLQDFSVSREKVRWGIPLPFDPKHNCYVWVEALQNYISAIGYGTASGIYQSWWPADIHLMAKDIIKFHAVYWPALLLAAGEPVPKQIFAHGFFTINKQKMSKTIGNVIDPNTLVETYGSDAARYLLLSQFPFGQDGDIKKDLFTEQYNAHLANSLGNLVSRTATLCEKYSVEISAAAESGKDVKEKVKKHLELLQFDNALKEIFGLIYAANKFLDEQAPWKIPAEENEHRADVLRKTVEQIRIVADLLDPFMPLASQRILQQFVGPKVKKGDSLFPRK